MLKNMSHGDHASHNTGMNMARLNMSHGDHASHQNTIDIGPEVRSGDVAKPILLHEGQEFNLKEELTQTTLSVGMMSLGVKSKTGDLVKCEVIDGGELKSRKHLNVRGKSATLPSITNKDWEDIKFGVDNEVEFYVVSFVKDVEVVHELKDYRKSKAMVARCDLGAELPIEEVPLLQFSTKSCESYAHCGVKNRVKFASQLELDFSFASLGIQEPYG
uniref:pyruvate kinase n=1 Tax=Lactuca sativa TaxID=4236 RepID=A0A9R1X4C6_LACSA|nr:hypothetical protein LSAT_V11C600311340 [Lactuca sativa]